MSSSMLKQVSSSRSFQGFQKVFEHESEKLQCKMKFGIYLPDCAVQYPSNKLPVLFWLSGISCTEENFMIKSGMQRFASANQIIVVNPDTSPRGDTIPADGPVDELTNLPFGHSAGFYLDATQPKYAKNFRMYSYIVEEFVPFVFSQFPVDQGQCSIFGHSMGGHGAIQIGLKNPGLFKSISAFAPITNPINSSAFGQKYYNNFFGPLEQNRDKWAEYDSTEIAKKYIGPKRAILVDQGSDDPLIQYLMPDNLVAVSNPNLIWEYRMHQGYDHGYFFIHTFIEDHFLFHKNCWAETTSTSSYETI